MLRMAKVSGTIRSAFSRWKRRRAAGRLPALVRQVRTSVWWDPLCTRRRVRGPGSLITTTVTSDLPTTKMQLVAAIIIETDKRGNSTLQIITISTRTVTITVIIIEVTIIMTATCKRVAVLIRGKIPEADLIAPTTTRNLRTCMAAITAVVISRASSSTITSKASLMVVITTLVKGTAALTLTDVTVIIKTAHSNGVTSTHLLLTLRLPLTAIPTSQRMLVLSSLKNNAGITVNWETVTWGTRLPITIDKITVHSNTLPSVTLKLLQPLHRVTDPWAESTATPVSNSPTARSLGSFSIATVMVDLEM